MKKADQFSFPIQFTGEYPNSWAGYIFLQMTQQNALHPGIDWNWGAGEDDFGKPVQAIANGVVVHQSKQDGIGYGVIVVLKHELTDQLRAFVKERYNIDTPSLYSFYAHLKEELLDDGQEIERGDLIGYVGKSGTTVSHLHSELYKPIPGTSWRYWPTLKDGWDADRLRKYYVDPYDIVINQPKPEDGDFAAKLLACKQELNERDIEKRQYESIARKACELLNCGIGVADVEKAVKEIINNADISIKLWNAIEKRINKTFIFPDQLELMLAEIEKLTTEVVVPTPPTEEPPQPDEPPVVEKITYKEMFGPILGLYLCQKLIKELEVK